MLVDTENIYLGDSFVIIKIKDELVYFRFNAETGPTGKPQI